MKKFKLITKWFQSVRSYKRVMSFKKILLKDYIKKFVNKKTNVLSYIPNMFSKIKFNQFVQFGTDFFFSKNTGLDHQSGYLTICYNPDFVLDSTKLYTMFLSSSNTKVYNRVLNFYWIQRNWRFGPSDWWNFKKTLVSNVRMFVSNNFVSDYFNTNTFFNMLWRNKFRRFIPWLLDKKMVKAFVSTKFTKRFVKYILFLRYFDWFIARDVVVKFPFGQKANLSQFYLKTIAQSFAPRILQTSDNFVVSKRYNIHASTILKSIYFIPTNKLTKVNRFNLSKFNVIGFNKVSYCICLRKQSLKSMFTSFSKSNSLNIKFVDKSNFLLHTQENLNKKNQLIKDIDLYKNLFIKYKNLIFNSDKQFFSYCQAKLKSRYIYKKYFNKLLSYKYKVKGVFFRYLRYLLDNLKSDELKLFFKMLDYIRRRRLIKVQKSILHKLLKLKYLKRSLLFKIEVSKLFSLYIKNKGNKSTFYKYYKKVFNKSLFSIYKINNNNKFFYERTFNKK